SPIPVEIDAYMNGTVVDVHTNEGCVIQNRGTLIQGIFGLGGEVKGPLNIVVEEPTESLKPEYITASMKGQIVVGGAYLPAETVKRAQACGVAGIVTGGFDYDDIKDLLGYEVGVAITGGEDLGLTIVVTEGFGHIQMAPGTFNLLKSHHARPASMNGATQIRAGVIRPEVIVTAQDHETSTDKWTPPEPVGIQIGDAVRGIRTPYFGRLGRVKSLPVELSVMASETKVRTMEVVFDDGTVALMPRANVESIDG
ncbi:MAG: hypothetical protein VX589_01510, partial [Myxococcota bacterium]|nr:hypothetical protein [Myxococcota bacterium]